MTIEDNETLWRQWPAVTSTNLEIRELRDSIREDQLKVARMKAEFDAEYGPRSTTFIFDGVKEPWQPWYERPWAQPLGLVLFALFVVSCGIGPIIGMAYTDNMLWLLLWTPLIVLLAWFSAPQ